MSDETNGTGREQVEEDLAEIRKNLRELTALSLRSEFNSVAYRKANDEWKEQMQAHIGHLTQLVSIFGDKTYEFDEKIKQVKETL